MVGGPDPSLRGHSIRRPSPPTESVSVCASATSASAEAVAAQDIENDIEDGDDDLRSGVVSTHAKDQEVEMRMRHTVTMTLTMIIMISAMAETMALMAPPIADTIAPCMSRSVLGYE